MYCQKCGKELKEDAKFCDQCGSMVSAAMNCNNSQSNLTLWQDIKAFIVKHKKGIATLFIIIAVFLAVCSVIDLLQSGGNGSSGSWRGNGGGSASGPMDILFIAISIVLVLISSKLLKRK